MAKSDPASWIISDLKITLLKLRLIDRAGRRAPLRQACCTGPGPSKELSFELSKATHGYTNTDTEYYIPTSTKKAIWHAHAFTKWCTDKGDRHPWM
jgi:hypothetical protein